MEGFDRFGYLREASLGVEKPNDADASKAPLRKGGEAPEELTASASFHQITRPKTHRTIMPPLEGEQSILWLQRMVGGCLAESVRHGNV